MTVGKAQIHSFSMCARNQYKVAYILEGGDMWKENFEKLLFVYLISRR